MIPGRGTFIGNFLFFILLLAAVLRLYGLDRLGLWADELWVVMDSSRGSLWDMFQTVYDQDNHPPGYYLLSRCTQWALGISDFAIRLPSALAGIVLVFVTFIVGRKRLSPEAGLLAAALVAGSYQAIYFSQEARPNIFVALFSLLSLHHFCVLLLEKNPARKNLVAFWLFASLNAYFHYAGLVFNLALFVIYLFSLGIHRNRSQLTSGIKMFLPVLLLYIPWLPGMYHDLVASPAEHWQRNPTPQILVDTFVYLFGPGDIRVYGYAVVLAGFPLWIAAVFSIKAWRLQYAGIAGTLALLWACIVLPIAFFYLKSSYSQSAYNHRHFLQAVPLLALLSGFVLVNILARFSLNHQRRALIVVVILIVAYQWQENNNRALYSANHFKQDYRESAKLVVDETRAAATSDIFIMSNSRFFDHYLEYFSQGKLKSHFLIESDQQLEALDLLLAQGTYRSFYYLEAPFFPAANQMLTERDQILARKYQPLCRSKFLRTQVIHFETTSSLTAATPDWENLPTCATKK